MGKKKEKVDLADLAEVLGKFIDGKELPTDEELDDDGDYIDLYQAIYGLKEALENVGYDVEGED